MALATMTAKNQITVPADLREDLGLARGDKLRFIKEPDGRYRVERADTLSSLRGILRSAVSLTDDELRQAIEDARNARADELMARLES